MLWIAGLGLAVLVVMAVVAGLITFHSNWGQERIRRMIVQEMEAEVNGTVSIEHLDTELSGWASARGIDIRGPNGHSIIHISSAALQLDVAAMAQGKLHLERVIIDGARIYASMDEGGRSNLSELFDTGLVGYTEDAPVIIDSFTIRDGRIEIVDRGRKLATFVDIELEGSGTITEFNTAIALYRGHARWHQGDIEVDFSGDFYTDLHMLLARRVKLKSRDSRVFVRTIANDFTSGRTEAAGHVYLAAADMLVACQRARKRVEMAVQICDQMAETPLPDIAVTATVSHESGEFPWFARAWIDGQGQGVDLGLDASLYVGVAQSPGADSFHGLQGLYGSIAGTVTVDSLEAMGGRTTASLDAYAVGNRVVATLEAEAPRGGGSAWLRAYIENERVHIDEAGVRATIPDLAPLSEELVAGRLSELKIDVAGPLDALDVDASARLDDLGVALTPGERLRIGQATARMSASAVSPSALTSGEWPQRGTVSLDSEELRYQDLRLGELTMRARIFEQGRRATVTVDASDPDMAGDSEVGDVLDRVHLDLSLTRRKNSTRISLGRYRLVTGKLDWRGRGGTITAYSKGGMRLDDIALASSAGRLSVEGAVNMGARERLEIDMTRLDLAQIGDLFDAGLSGTVSGTWRLEQGRAHWLVEGSSDFLRVTWGPDVPALSGTVKVDLQDDLLLAQVNASLPRARGRASVDIEVVPPADPFDMAAWQGIGRDRVRHAEVVARRVKLDALRELLQQPEELPVTGMVGGTVTYRSAPDALSMHVYARNVAIRDQGRPGPGPGPGMERALAMQMKGTWTRQGLEGHMELSHEARPVVFADYRLGAGIAALWSQVHGQSGAALQQATLRADVRIGDVQLRRLQRAGLIGRESAPLAPSLGPGGLSGELSGLIEVRGTMAEPRVMIPGIEIRDLYARGFKLERMVMTGALRQDHLSAKLRAWQPGGGVLEATGTYRWAGPEALDAEVLANDFNLATLRLFATKSTDVLASIDGTLDAQLRARGKLEQPRITGSATIENGEMWLAGASRHIHDARVALEFQPRTIIMRELSAEIDQGSVKGSGIVKLGNDYMPRSFEMRVDVQEVAVFSPEYTARTTLGATIKGSYQQEAEAIRVRVEIADNARVIVDQSDRTLQSTDPLADVVYVGETAREQDQGQGREPGQKRATADSSLPTARIIVTAPQGIRVIGEEFNMLIRPRPRIVVRIANGELVEVSGSLNVVSGQVTLFDQRYRVEYATVQFDNQLPTNPSVNVELRSDFPSATVFIQVSGTVEDPRITLSSNPSMDETTILAIMLGQEPGTTDEALTAGAVSAGTLLAGKLRQRLPVRVDVIRTHHDGITIGRWLSENLLLGYRYRTAPDNRQNANEATIHWRFDPNWLLEGHYGDNDVGGVDLLWNYRF